MHQWRIRHSPRIQRESRNINVTEHPNPWICLQWTLQKNPRLSNQSYHAVRSKIDTDS